jgi:amino acid adenylation domain-containing protein
LGAPDWLGSLFYPLVRLKGVHIQEGFPCFLTTAHTQADIDAIADAFSQALDELQAADILVGSSADAVPALATPSTPEAPREAPVTEPQMEILLAAQLGEAASCAFNESLTLTLSGPLDLGRLTGALNDVVSRHDALRARFPANGESFEVAPHLTLALGPLEAGSEAEAEALLANVVAREARTPFDLNRGPLVRATLVRLAPERHALVLTAHHIVCDGWSFNVILEELAACYRARRSGVPHGLPAPMSFAQHAIDTRARSSDGSATERFWLDQFAGIPTPPELPTDRARPAQRSYSGDTYTAHFDAAFLKALKKAGARHGATLFTTLLAGLQALVGRLSNHTDIVIAAPAAGQSLVGDRVLVGHCVNFLPLRAPFAWSARFCDHLRFLQQRVLDAYEHQDYTYGTLLRKLRPPRAPNRLPLTEIQFNLERISSRLDFGGAVGLSAPNPKAHANFDLFFNCIESPDGLRIDCDYNSDLFDRATIARWIRHYHVLLEGAIADASVAISHLPLLSSEEQSWLLDTLNNTAVAPPSERVDVLIAAQAAARGDAVACVDAAGWLTYAELDARANRLARLIRDAAPHDGGRVAVALERTCNLIVALLAVMKSGHAYVPLDPDLPPARLQQILQEADVAVFVCGDAAGAANAPARARVLRLDQLSLDEGDASPPLLDGVSDDSPAYAIFTSGTTGRPKGVEVSHRALANVLAYAIRETRFTANDTIVAVSTISFDIAAFEVFGPLLAGGRVVIATRDVVRDGFALLKLIREHGATVLQGTPALWKMLLEAGFAPRPDLRMHCTGESLPRDLADRLVAGGALWNLYGPTETTVWSALGRVAPEGPIVIGAPVANTQLHVLDERDQLAPIGVVGRLHIGGLGLANGYFRQPEMTARAFRMLSVAGRPPQRCYDTGDLARRLPSGDIQVLGRADHQVKLRGFRIELEEIEVVLRKAPGVQACAVALRSDVGEEPALAAYYVASRDLDAADLAAFVRARLPDYMAPSHWMRLERLPLSPSGKLDRKALPAPALALAPGEPRTVERARTPLEAQIIDVWEAVLGRTNIGVNDPIFALGADSLQIFRIAARLSKQGLAVEARELMKNPTAAIVAKALEGMPAQARETPVRSGPALADFRHGARRQKSAPS